MADDIKYHDVNEIYLSEITLRDLFAAFALAGMTAGSLGDRVINAEKAARFAYEYADAALRVREEAE